MDWDTALRQELKRFNTKASRSIAKKKAGQAPNESQVSTPTTWDEALKRMLPQARRQVARAENAKLHTSPERTTRAE